MKKSAIAFLSLLTLCTSLYAAAPKKGTLASRIGEEPEDSVPCKCIFDRNRRSNPEKIVWKNAVWKCSNYLDNGACSRVEKVKDISVE